MNGIRPCDSTPAKASSMIANSLIGGSLEAAPEVVSSTADICDSPGGGEDCCSLLRKLINRGIPSIPENFQHPAAYLPSSRTTCRVERIDPGHRDAAVARFVVEKMVRENKALGMGLVARDRVQQIGDEVLTAVEATHDRFHLFEPSI